MSRSMWRVYYGSLSFSHTLLTLPRGTPHVVSVPSLLLLAGEESSVHPTTQFLQAQSNMVSQGRVGGSSVRRRGE